jgi:hypothetical protein
MIEESSTEAAGDTDADPALPTYMRKLLEGQPVEQLERIESYAMELAAQKQVGDEETPEDSS